MADRFTPGPLTPTTSNRADGDVGLLDDHRNVVAECYAAIRHKDERADDEAMANARLFGAAQEMLLALQALVDLEPDNSADFDGEPEKYAAARAAIAKATGSAS